MLNNYLKYYFSITFPSEKKNFFLNPKKNLKKNAFFLVIADKYWRELANFYAKHVHSTLRK